MKLGFSFLSSDMRRPNQLITTSSSSSSANAASYPELLPFTFSNNINNSDPKQIPTFDPGMMSMPISMSTTTTNSISSSSSPPKLEDFLGGPTMAAAAAAAAASGEHHLHYVETLSLFNKYVNNGEYLNTLMTLSSSSSMNMNMNTTPPYHHDYSCVTTPAPQLLLTSSAELDDAVDDHDQSSSLAAAAAMANNNINNKRSFDDQKQMAAATGHHRKSIDTFGQRTSQYRGVTRHRWTGRYEAHLWDNTCKKEGQTRKGRQVYLGGYDMEEKAARAYDLAALKYWGLSTHINFQLENYTHEVEEMKNMTRQEYVAHLRRRSSGFSRGASIYRGVTRHHQHGRWQARIGRVSGNKDLYLGTFSTQEEAAEAYDIAAIKFRGTNAVTNFDMSRYDVEKIIASNALPAAEMARRESPDQMDPQVIKTAKQVRLEGNNNIVDNMGDIADWRMVLYNQTATQKNSCCDPTGLNGLVGLEPPFGLSQLEPHVKSMTKLDHHFSNPSSLVTSLCSSREESPIAKTHPFVGVEYGNLSSLPPTPPRISIPHYMPFFAAWNES